MDRHELQLKLAETIKAADDTWAAAGAVIDMLGLSLEWGIYDGADYYPAKDEREARHLSMLEPSAEPATRLVGTWQLARMNKGKAAAILAEYVYRIAAEHNMEQAVARFISHGGAALHVEILRLALESGEDILVRAAEASPAQSTLRSALREYRNLQQRDNHNNRWATSSSPWQ